MIEELIILLAFTVGWMSLLLLGGVLVEVIIPFFIRMIAHEK